LSPANPKLLTLGDTVWSEDIFPGDMLALDGGLIPTWGIAKRAEHVDPSTATVTDIVNALVAAGLMKDASP
jgi:hypothetical protein